MKKITYIVLSLLLCFGCTSTSKQKSDMSGYEKFTDTEHVFYDMTVKEMIQEMDDNETFIVYFGFSECPYCNQAMPILNEVAKEYDQEVGYINTRKDSSWESNTDIDDYDLVIERLGDYLEYDDEGKKHLYTPHVFFIKDGKVVKQYEGVGDTTDALKSIYEEGFEAVK